jgi:hypothetical protein
LCRSNEPGHLAAGIRRVMDMPPEVRERMVLDARAAVRKLAGEDVVLANLLGIYLDAFERVGGAIADRHLEDAYLRRCREYDVEIQGPQGKLVYLMGFNAARAIRIDVVERRANWEVGKHPQLGDYYRYNGSKPSEPIRFRVRGEGCKIHFLRSEKSDYAIVRIDDRSLRVALDKVSVGHDLWLSFDDVIRTGRLAPERPPVPALPVGTNAPATVTGAQSALIDPSVNGRAERQARKIAVLTKRLERKNQKLKQLRNRRWGARRR